ncbi:MAG: FGGY family carbohydrate kinase [Actinomycetota bacterium]|nr:FGGY family carbohydrate kinase [Actinomycetota bacterium]
MTARPGDLVAGVDVATRDVRVAVSDCHGHVRAFATEALPAPARPRPSWSEQDPAVWWPGVVSALRQATDALDGDGGRIVSVSVSATSGTVLLADGDGEAMGPALMYDDQRASAEAERAQEAGRQRWGSLGLVMSSSFGLPKWAWLLSEGGMGDRARHAWHVSDLVVSKLTGGPPPTDTSHALKSGYDPLRHRWAEEAMEALGVPMEILPEVLPPTTSIGSVSPGAASQTGLPTGCQVHLGMTDSCASQMAAGADQPGRFVSVLGTTLAMKGATRELLRDPTGAVYSHWHPDGWWLPGGASNTGGAALRETFPDADLASLDREAAAHGPAGCVVYPLIGTGERFPFVQADAEGFRLGSASDEVDAYRATLEGVAFLERLALAHVTALGAELEPPLAVAGAASRSEVWNQVRATVLGVPLVVPERAETSFGACLLAAAGRLHDNLADASRAMVRVEQRVEAVEEERDQLDASYRRFVTGLVERGWLGEGLRGAAFDDP